MCGGGGDDGTAAKIQLISQLDPREYVSQLATFGYALIRGMIESTPDEALRTIVHPNLTNVVHACTLSPRLHDDMMLRTPRRGEPMCARRDNCEATKLRFTNSNVTGRPAMAYWSPADWQARCAALGVASGGGGGGGGTISAATTAPPPLAIPANSNNRMCLLCLRTLVGEANASMLAAGTAIGHHDRALVDFYNEVDVPGEYRLIDTIGAGRFFNGIAGNIVAHDRYAFTLEEPPGTGGLQIFRQRYEYPTLSTDGTNSAVDSLREALVAAERVGFSVASFA